MKYLFYIAIGLDQLINAVLGGLPDETFSSRCYRCRRKQPYKLLKAIIDGLFFWEDQHCYQSYISELNHTQASTEVREWR
jgi:hypothetical protein